MLRYGLLGGSRPPLPWEFFITIGGASIAADLLFTVLYPLWNTFAWAGAIETGVFLIVGGVLVAVGPSRRSRDQRRS